MRRVLIDTDVVIDYLRAGAGPLEELLVLAGNGGVILYISAVTILELFSGEIKKEHTKVMVNIEERIEVITVDKELARYLGGLRRDAGSAISVQDLIIAGSAVFVGAEVATRNKKHFGVIPGIKFYQPKFMEA